MNRFEIEHTALPDGTRCGHIAVGHTEDHAEREHLHHCLVDHEWSDDAEQKIRDRIDELER
ncbi:hypothetical protein [Halorarum salinum]|uniref:Uncharacterized protein n=1 Tax=Halorarum salinum TaxID=2743089 RepID=A0A7D5QH90_9EURY|nr:hypothetical protein [Halobaculum salinum]QLG62064.1 hypothetical protein HUG12_10125 [Halobaculum salinum]